MKHFHGKRGHHKFHGFKRRHEEFHGHKNRPGKFCGFKQGHHKFPGFERGYDEFHDFKGRHHEFHGHERHRYNQEEVARIMQLFAKTTENDQSNAPETNEDDCVNSGVSETEIVNEHMSDGNVDELAEYWESKFKKMKKFAKHERKWKCKNKRGKFEKLMNTMILAAYGDKVANVSDGADEEGFQNNGMRMNFSESEDDGMHSGNSSEPGPSEVKKMKNFAKHEKKWKWKHYGNEELKQLIEILGKVTERKKITGVGIFDDTDNKTDSNPNEAEVGKETPSKQMEDGEADQPTEPVAENEADQPTEPVAEGEADQPTEPLAEGEADQPRDLSAEMLSKLPKFSCWLSKCKKLKKFRKHEKKWKCKRAKRLGKGNKKFKMDKMKNKDIELLLEKGNYVNGGSGLLHLVVVV